MQTKNVITGDAVVEVFFGGGGMIGGEGRGRASDRSFAMVVAFGVGWCLISGGVCGVRLGHGCGGGV